jgi:uncharacterized protein (DUF1697 family)
MKYVALLRGINVGNNKRIDMKKFKTIFELIGYKNVLTYINSGNVIFESEHILAEICKEIKINLAKEFGFEIPTLVKTEQEMKKIVEAIPNEWENNSLQKTDVAYLFPEIDSKETINLLPMKKEYVDIRYIEGAIIWNVDKENYNKSQLNKLIGHRFYKLMTVRNVNTARHLLNFL